MKNWIVGLVRFCFLSSSTGLLRAVHHHDHDHDADRCPTCDKLTVQSSALIDQPSATLADADPQGSAHCPTLQILPFGHDGDPVTPRAPPLG